MLIQIKKSGGKRALAAVLASGILFLTGCGAAPLEENVSAPENGSSSEAPSESASVQTPSSKEPPEEDPAAEALSEMRQLTTRAAEYWGQLEKLVKPAAEGGKQLDAALEQIEAALEQAGKADTYKAAEQAVQEAAEGLAGGEQALTALEGADQLLEQAEGLVEQLEELQSRAEALLENPEGAKKDSMPLLKELIDKEVRQAAEEKTRLEQAIEAGKSFDEQKEELSKEGEDILAEKKAEQLAAEQAKAEEAAKAQAAESSKEAASSKAPAASADKGESSSGGSKKVVVKKPQEDDKDKNTGSSSYTRLTKVEDYILKQMNDYRVSLGLSKLTRADDLDDCAAIRVVEMLDNDLFSHTRPDGTSWKTVLTENGIKPMAWGEIQYRQRGTDIIKGDSAMASKSISAWKKSKGHDAVMRSKAYSKVGIAAYSSGGTIWIADVVFIE